jgi:hypothetical protein
MQLHFTPALAESFVTVADTLEVALTARDRGGVEARTTEMGCGPEPDPDPDELPPPPQPQIDTAVITIKMGSFPFMGTPFRKKYKLGFIWTIELR